MPRGIRIDEANNSDSLKAREYFVNTIDVERAHIMERKRQFSMEKDKRKKR